MTKRSSTTTRRDVLAGVGFFAGIAVAAPAVAELVKAPQDGADAKWREFIEGMAFAHPNGRAAAENARAHGMKLADLSCITLHDETFPPEDLPVLWFGDLQKGEHYFNVSPQWCGEYRSVRRGSGPCIIAPAGKAVRA